MREEITKEVMRVFNQEADVDDVVTNIINITTIKNFDKLKSDQDREFVKAWSKITTVTINDEGFYMLDLIPEPGFKI
jgi:hypothetical protein